MRQSSSSFLLGSLVVVVGLAAPLSEGAAQELEKRVAELERQVKDANEWRRAESTAHLAGYGAITYTDTRAGGPSASFSGVQFNPIFHYQYRDLVMLESELELEAKSDGETETKLEYLAVDVVLNDYAMLVAGKFLSPLGQFRQNTHPLWINKLASAPPGFGKEQAAPEAEVGLQLRGGVPLGAARANYSVYVGNGPELEADGGEIEAIGNEGFTRDQDDKKIVGARIGFLPMPALEFGVSAASGQATVTKNGGSAYTGDPARDYDAAGADVTYTVAGVRLMGEYIQQKVAAAAASVAPEAGKWKAWYVQASYLIPSTSVEVVVRRADYDSPHASQDQKQIAVGVNYLFAPHLIAKLTYEANDGQSGAASDRDRVLAQLAYGF